MPLGGDLRLMSGGERAFGKEDGREVNSFPYHFIFFSSLSGGLSFCFVLVSDSRCFAGWDERGGARRSFCSFCFVFSCVLAGWGSFLWAPHAMCELRASGPRKRNEHPSPLPFSSLPSSPFFSSPHFSQ